MMKFILRRVRWIAFWYSLSVLLVTGTHWLGQTSQAVLMVRLFSYGETADTFTERVEVTDLHSGVRVQVKPPWGWWVKSDGGCWVYSTTPEVAPHEVITLDLNTGDLRHYPLPEDTVYQPLALGGVSRLIWSPDRRWLALNLMHVEKNERPLLILDTTDGSVKRIMRHIYAERAEWIDDTHFLFAWRWNDTKTYIYDVVNETLSMTLAPQSAEIHSSALWMTDNFMVVAHDNALWIYDDSRQRTDYPLNLPDGMMLNNDLRYETTALSSDHQRVTFTAINEGTQQTSLYLYNLLTGEPVLLATLGEYEHISQVTWSPDGNRLAYRHYYPSGAGFTEAIVVDGHTGERLTRIMEEYISEVLWSPNSRYLLVRSQRLQLLDVQTGSVSAWEEAITSDHVTDTEYRSQWSRDSDWFTVKVYPESLNGNAAMHYRIAIERGKMILRGQTIAGLFDPVQYCYPD